MIRVNIRINPEIAEEHGLDEDTMFEAFYKAPNLCIHQLSEGDLEELFEPDFDEECKGCYHYCKAQGRCLLDQDS